MKNSDTCVFGLTRPSLVLLLLFGLALETQAADSSLEGPAISYEFVKQPDVRALSDWVDIADVRAFEENLQLVRPNPEQLFTAGWNGIGTSDNGDAIAWTLRSSAVLHIPLIRREPLVVRVSFALPEKPLFKETQKFRFIWNGTIVKGGALTKGNSTVEFSVKPQLQTVGLNRFEIQPQHWAGYGPDQRGIGLTGMTMQLEEQEVVTRGDLVRREGTTVLLASGTTMSIFMPTPREARLSGTLTFGRDDLNRVASIDGGVSIFLMNEDGIQTEVFRQHLSEFASSPLASVDVDLSTLGDHLIGLTFSFWRKPGADEEPLYVEWRDFKVSGSKAKPIVSGLKSIADRYNVLMILFDTLRADYTEPYGSKEVQTPAMAKLASEGITFLNSYSTYPSTRASTASFFTGTYPVVHGILRNESLPKEMPYFPQILSDNGYRTLSILHNPGIGPDFGFDRGFDQMHRAWTPKLRASIRFKDQSAKERAEATWDNLIQPFLEKDTHKPFFIYDHEIDPHAPYTSNRPFDTIYDPEHRQSMYNLGTRDLTWMLRAGTTRLSKAEIRFIDSRYKSEITFMDRYLEALLGRLGDSKFADNTVVVFLSDHGEEIMDHGLIGHSHSLYEELLRVPLILRLPDVFPAEKRPAVFAQLHDLSPTLLALLGIETPPNMQGMNLLPYAFLPDDYEPDRLIYGSGGYDPEKLTESVRFRNWKLIKTTVNSRLDHQYTFELYNLEKDPDEIVNVWRKHLVVAKTLEQMMRFQAALNERAATQQAEEVDMDALPEDVKDQLRALGYI